MVDTNFYKELILKKIKQLTSKKADDNVDLDGDEGDAIQGAMILSVVHEYSARVKKQLGDLNNALIKIGNGDYGSCEDCGENISPKRLTICPEARYCVVCAELIERGKP